MWHSGHYYCPPLPQSHPNPPPPAPRGVRRKVLQNIYTKRLMSGGKFTFWEIHLFCGAASLLILLPVLAVQATSVTWASVWRWVVCVWCL